MKIYLYAQQIGRAYRILWYFSTWLLAVVAIQLILKPQGVTETALSATQQRIRWFLWTPISIVVGLAQAITWPKELSAWAVVTSAICLLVIAVVALVQDRAKIFFVAMILQIIVIIVSVIYLKRLDSLPRGS